MPKSKQYLSKRKRKRNPDKKHAYAIFQMELADVGEEKEEWPAEEFPFWSTQFSKRYENDGSEPYCHLSLTRGDEHVNLLLDDSMLKNEPFDQLLLQSKARLPTNLHCPWLCAFTVVI